MNFINAIARYASPPNAMKKLFTIGLDLGQAQDFTALVVLERFDEPGSKPTFQLRHAERYRGRPYPEVVESVRVLLSRPPLAGASLLAVDATGVGAPVVDMFRRAQLAARVLPIKIHGGDRVIEERGEARVPKRDLVGMISVLLQTDRLRIAPVLPLAPVLVAELRTFRATVNPATAHESFAAWREADHDDLVLATALAAWAACRFGVVGAQVVGPQPRPPGRF